MTKNRNNKMIDVEEILHDLHETSQTYINIGQLLVEGIASRDPQLIRLSMEASIAFRNIMSVSKQVAKGQILHHEESQDVSVDNN